MTKYFCDLCDVQVNGKGYLLKLEIEYEQLVCSKCIKTIRKFADSLKPKKETVSETKT